MKLICLNIWGGRVYEPLMKFIKEQSKTADIFCFQEVFRSPRKDMEITESTRIHIFDELAAALPDFNRVFHPVASGIDDSGPVDFDIEIGQAEFVRKTIPIASSGEIEIYSPKDKTTVGVGEFMPRKFGYLKIGHGGGLLTVVNVHGMTSDNDNKLDTPERLKQSRAIMDFTAKEAGRTIICGDFNILPQAESIKMFSDPLVDLIKNYGIKSTRSKISPWYGTPGEMKFSDYVFVSADIKVKNFAVPDVEISDHLPLILEFS